MRARWLVLAPAPLLTACPMEPARFAVDIGDTDPESAALEIAGEARPMRREGDGFSASRVVHREGPGAIVLRYADGGTIACAIPALEHGASGTYRFRVENGECHAL